MANSFSFKTNAVTCGISYNRERALHYCVLRCPSLWLEWREFAENFPNHENWKSEEFREHINAFIKEKSIKIVSEKPFLKTIKDKYVIQIAYIFEW